MAGIKNEVIYGSNVDFSGGATPSAKILTNGQLLIGRTSLNAGGTHIDVNTLTAGSGISITNGPGTIKINNTIPNVNFDTDFGSATQAGGTLNIFGTTPIDTSGSGNTITISTTAISRLVLDIGFVVADGINTVDFLGGFHDHTFANQPFIIRSIGPTTAEFSVQTAFQYASSSSANAGVASFDSADFSVDVNGFVSLAGSSGAGTITGDSGGALSQTANNWNIFGSGSITTSGSGSTLTTQLTGLTNHAVLVGAGTSTITKLAIGSTGQVLQGVSAGDPTWSTATFPSTATSTGTILRADGTNWVATTSTYPNTNAVSTLLYASSANVMSDLTTANNGLLVTSNTGVPSILAGPGTTGNILQSNAAAAPSFSTATYPSSTTVSQILYSSATNVVSGLATANRAVVTTNSTGVPVVTALATDGQLIIGSTAGAPAAATLTAGSNITITNASNSITIAAGGLGIAWSKITADQTAAVNTGYICNKAGLLTLTMPATSSIGDIIAFVNINTAAGAKFLSANPGQLNLGSAAATANTGSLASTALGDVVFLVCSTANTTWYAYAVQGNITVA